MSQQWLVYKQSDCTVACSETYPSLLNRLDTCLLAYVPVCVGGKSYNEFTAYRTIILREQMVVETVV